MNATMTGTATETETPAPKPDATAPRHPRRLPPLESCPLRLPGTDLTAARRAVAAWVADRPHGATAGEVARRFGLHEGQAFRRLRATRALGLIDGTEYPDGPDDPQPLIVWTRTARPMPPDPSEEEARREAEAQEARLRGYREKQEADAKRRREAWARREEERAADLEAATAEIRAEWDRRRWERAARDAGATGPVEYAPIKIRHDGRDWR